MGEAEVEKRALVRFALFTALRERRVTPREVSIVFGDEGQQLQRQRRKAVGFVCKEFGTVPVFSIQTQNQLRRYPAQPESWKWWTACLLARAQRGS
jgi:hypothetical protein